VFHSLSFVLFICCPSCKPPPIAEDSFPVFQEEYDEVLFDTTVSLFQQETICRAPDALPFVPSYYHIQKLTTGRVSYLLRRVTFAMLTLDFTRRGDELHIRHRIFIPKGFPPTWLLPFSTPIVNGRYGSLCSPTLYVAFRTCNPPLCAIKILCPFNDDFFLFFSCYPHPATPNPPSLLATAVISTPYVCVILVRH